jgi:hypothetical protein
VKKNRRYRARVEPVTGSFFTEHAHRLPETGEPIAYAMACVEVIANFSPRGAELYREVVRAWAAPEVKGFYKQFMAEVPEEDVLEWKEKLGSPGPAFLTHPCGPNAACRVVHDKHVRHVTA